VNLVEDHHGSGTVAIKHLRIADHVLDGGQIAIDLKGTLRTEVLGQGGFAGSAHTGQPGNGSFAPGLLDSLLPERSWNDAVEIYYWLNYMQRMIPH
jgi:hypothetical protein